MFEATVNTSYFIGNGIIRVKCNFLKYNNHKWGTVSYYYTNKIIFENKLNFKILMHSWIIVDTICFIM